MQRANEVGPEAGRGCLVHLARALLTYPARNCRESELQRAMQGLLIGTPRPLDRAQFAPGHFTASALVLSPDLGHLLLIYHHKLERWLQPGGHFEPSDADAEQAARRELLEETGITRVNPLRPGLYHLDVHEIPVRKAEPLHQHYDLRVAWIAESLELPGGSDPHPMRWMPLEGLAELGTDASVVDAARCLARERAGV